MFESRAAAARGLDDLLTELLHVEDSWIPNAARVDQLDALERAKSAISAAQARVTAAFVTEEEQVAAEWYARAREAADANDFDRWRAARDEARRHQVAGDETVRRSGRRADRVGVAAQIALALRVSPSRGSVLVRVAQTLAHDLPSVLVAMETGVLSARRAELVVQEVAVLTADQRRILDGELAGSLAAEWGHLGDRELVRRVRAAVYRLAAAAALARCRVAESARRVSLRPAPDTMCHLTATLPVAQGVAALAALTRSADAAKAGGDARDRGQLMADALVARLTGAESVADLSVEVQVVMTDRALLHGHDEPAHVPGYGTVPAAWAMALVSNAGQRGGDVSTRARVWVRRLYTHPDDGTLVAMDSTRRTFGGGLRQFLVARDGTCRDPWCDAPIRHLDHVVDYAHGGRTSAANGQGLCARGNYTKQQPGWRARVVGSEPHTVETATPSGHRYRSLSPPVIAGSDDGPSQLEATYATVLAG